MYVCLYVYRSRLGTLIYVHDLHAQSRFQWGYAHQVAGLATVHVQDDAARSSKSLCLSTSMSVNEASKHHGTEAMDNSRLHSESTSKPDKGRYQRSATVNDAPKPETGSHA